MGDEGRPEMTEADVASMFTRESWDARYGAADRVWSGRPNQRLVEQVGAVEADGGPGAALDVGCGEGADVVWLAHRGWRVTGVDISPVALDRARTHADAEGVGDRVDLVEHDVLAGGAPPSGPDGGHDLVTVHFLHPPPDRFAEVYGALAAAVAPGGRLLVVGHHPSDLETGVRRPDFPGLLFEPDRVLAVLADPDAPGWEIEVAEVAARAQTTADGPVTVHDTVVRARRERTARPTRYTSEGH